MRLTVESSWVARPGSQRVCFAMCKRIQPRTLSRRSHRAWILCPRCDVAAACVCAAVWLFVVVPWTAPLEDADEIGHLWSWFQLACDEMLNPAARCSTRTVRVWYVTSVKWWIFMMSRLQGKPTSLPLRQPKPVARQMMKICDWCEGTSGGYEELCAIMERPESSTCASMKYEVWSMDEVCKDIPIVSGYTPPPAGGTFLCRLVTRTLMLLKPLLKPLMKTPHMSL